MTIFHIHRNILYTLILFFLLCLMSCSSEDNTFAGGGIGGTGVTSTGTITAIGSVWVNGIEYDTAKATVTINDILVGTGNQAVVDSLNPGQVISVTGILTQSHYGRADAVSYFSTLLGPIQAIDTVDGYDRIFYILDQEVVITGETVVKGGNLDDFTIGSLVQVSGFMDDTGQIQASHISKEADTAKPNDLLRVSGIVSSLDENNTTFFINSLEINYALAGFAGFSQDGLTEGMWVHVSGYLEDGNPEFVADKIRPFNRLGPKDGLYTEIEAIAAGDLAGNGFYLEDHLVQVEPQTKFIGGSAEEIFAGTRLVVKGYLTEDLLIADRIKFKTSFKAESELAAKDNGNYTLVLSGLADLSIKTNSLTRFNGIRKTFEDLTIGDHLNIKGWITSDNKLLASQIISTPAASGKVTILGAVSDISTPNLTINTIVVNTNDIPPDGFFTEDGSPLSQEEFLSLVAQGDIVNTRGELTAGDSISWKRIALLGR